MVCDAVAEIAKRHHLEVPAADWQALVQQGTNRTGLGLGRSLVVEAMKAHGGSVRARNIPGRGCAFTLSLPTVQS